MLETAVHVRACHVVTKVASDSGRPHRWQRTLRRRTSGRIRQNLISLGVDQVIIAQRPDLIRTKTVQHTREFGDLSLVRMVAHCLDARIVAPETKARLGLPPVAEGTRPAPIAVE